MEKFDEACSVKSVKKSFGRTVAVNDVTLSIHHGEIFALVGPNGAGKTTLIKLILGMLKPDHGKILVLDASIPKERGKILQKLGYLPQERALYESLTVRENLWFFGKIKGMEKRYLKERMQELIEQLELTDHENKLVMHCSGGIQQRTALAAAVIHEPNFLILDEPTVGLDPLLRVEFWEYFHDLQKKKEVTVLLTTHYLQEAEEADRVCLMQDGKILVIDTPQGLKKSHVEDNMEQAFIKALQSIQGGENHD